MTSQFKASINGIFKGGKSSVYNMCELLEGFAFDKQGLQSVAEYLQTCKMGEIDRMVLIQVMSRALAATSKMQDENPKMMFVLHHVVADVESMFPGFAGKVTLKSVQTGFGSNFALICLTRHLPAGTSYRQRLKYVHHVLMQHLVDLANGGEQGLTILCSMGYVIDSASGTRKIVSIFSGREFSLTDTEHLCCKYYVCICHAHPTRTGSDCPETHASHCWPIQGDDNNRPWMEWVSTIFDKIRQASESKEHVGQNYYENKYPKELTFFGYELSVGEV